MTQIQHTQSATKPDPLKTYITNGIEAETSLTKHALHVIQHTLTEEASSNVS